MEFSQTVDALVVDPCAVQRSAGEFASDGDRGR